VYHANFFTLITILNVRRWEA